jgi:hypothetical protein
MFPENHKYILLLPLILLISCFEEDTAVSPWPGEVITIPEDIEKFFSHFDLETGAVVASYPADSWQIGFACGKEGWHIQINSGDGWFLWNSEQTNINAEITPPQEVLWSYDKQSAFPDSTAAGNWVDTSGDSHTYTYQVYFLGNYISGKYYDIMRLQFVHVDELHYRFLLRDEGLGTTDSATVTKSDTSNFVYYNIQTQQQVNPEPRKESFDLTFAPYYDLATQLGVTIPYLVRGTFLNAWETTAVLDSIHDYDQIGYEMLGEYAFSERKDVIGYRWKDISIDPVSGRAAYKVKTNYSYIIRTSSGNYYKLRFLSFSIDGESGYPRFEYKELKPLQ